MFDWWWEIVRGSNPGGILSSQGKGKILSSQGKGKGDVAAAQIENQGKYCSIPTADSHILTLLKIFIISSLPGRGEDVDESGEILFHSNS